jgi:hypothetical protein
MYLIQQDRVHLDETETVSGYDTTTKGEEMWDYKELDDGEMQ